MHIFASYEIRRIFCASTESLAGDLRILEGGPVRVRNMHRRVGDDCRGRAALKAAAEAAVFFIFSRNVFDQARLRYYTPCTI